MKRILLAAIGALALVACADTPTDESESSAATGCGAGLVNLNDACNRKVQPSNRERSLTCPVVSTDASGFTASDDAAAPEIDVHAFDRVAPFDSRNPVRVAAVIVRRVAGKPYYQYLSNGHHDDIVQPWSSSKWIGVMAAGAHLRAVSNREVGLTGSVDGHPLGDLVTDMATYQNRLSSSNGTARWFKNIAGRGFTNTLVSGWLGRSGEELRGGYGPDLAPYGYTITSPVGAHVAVPNDDASGNGITNMLSMSTELEAMKRLAVWDDAETRLPNLEAEDVQTILYGAEKPIAYRGEAGGLQRDQAIYMQNALDIAEVERASHGKWRIFSKLGNGEGTRPGLGTVAEIAHVAYACAPVLDEQDRPIPDRGAELVLAIHHTSKTSAAGDVALDALYRRIVQEVLLPRAAR